MDSLFSALFTALSASFRSRAALQLEILALRHQVGVLQRSVKRPKLTPYGPEKQMLPIQAAAR